MKHLIVCLFAIIPGMLAAQYSIELFPSDQSGSWNLHSWSMQLNVPGTETQGFLTIEILDEQQRSIYQTRSHLFQLAGFKQVRSLAGLSLEAQASDPLIDQWIQVTGCLPEGRYLIRLRVFNINNQPLAAKDLLWRPSQPCTMPLHLIAPAHRAKLAATPAGFNWTTPFSQSAFPDLVYELSLVEQFDHQSKEQAILHNPSLLQQQVSRGQLSYPPLGSTLESGHTYTWMVTAQWKGKTVGRSEVWTFTIAEEEPDTAPESSVPNPSIYFKTGSPQYPPVYQLRESVLGFYYKNTSPNEQLHLQLSDELGQTFAHRPLDQKPGTQYVQLDLSPLGITTGESKKKYRLDILHKNKRIETLFFQF